MELRIVGTQIWLNNILMSEGLQGPAYAAKLRDVEELAQIMRDRYDQGFEDGETAGYKSGYDEGRQIAPPVSA